MSPEFSLPTFTYGILILPFALGFLLKRAPLRSIYSVQSTSTRQCSNSGELHVVFVLQSQGRGLCIFLEVFNRRCPWDRQHYRGTLQQPRQRNLLGRFIVSLRNPLEYTAGHGS